MRIIFIRHAIAGDRKAFPDTGQQNDLRPLTKTGKKKMNQASRGLLALEPKITVLATSPLLRAVQTGKIVASQYESIEPVQIPQLLPRKGLAGLLTWVQSHKS